MEKTSTNKKRASKAQNNVAVEKPAKIEAPVSNGPVVAKSLHIDEDQYVTVYNGSHGILIYKSKRTGETYVWDEYGAEQEMTVKELRDARNSAKKFFEANWFMFDENTQWVIDYLGLRNYYINAPGFGKFDEIFKLSPDVLAEKISKMSKGQKDAVAHRAHQLIADGEIDSRKTIATLESSLGIELIER